MTPNPIAPRVAQRRRRQPACAKLQRQLYREAFLSLAALRAKLRSVAGR